jgi:hypothetical protein
MKRIAFFMAGITLCVFLLPAPIQAHESIFEPELFRKNVFEKPCTDAQWEEKVKGFDGKGLYGAPVELGGEDWSFKFPFIIQPGQISLAVAVNGWLSPGDVDVAKYTAAAGEEFCIQISIIPPLCTQYKKFYPVIGILGPGVPSTDDFPFEYPADCKNCGYMETHPTKAKVNEKRPGGSGPSNAFPRMGFWYYIDWNTDVVQANLKGPGTFYIVWYDPAGKGGDYCAMWGWDECDKHYKPEDMYLHKFNAQILDELKYTHRKCWAPEAENIGEIPPAAIEPQPPFCGQAWCSPEASKAMSTCPYDFLRKGDPQVRSNRK